MLTGLIERHNTIGHQILDLEAELGANDSHKETLDILIHEAEARIAVKDSYTRQDAMGILSTINTVIRANGLNLRTVDGNDLFHEALIAKSIDCDDTSLIYLSIADALRIPLAVVAAPQHLFVRFMLNDGSHINWETTSAEELSDNYYKQLLNISDAAIENGVFLKNLTRDGIIASAYNNRGIAWAEKGNLDEAIKDYNEAIRLKPNYAEAYYGRGVAWSEKGNLDEAIRDYSRAIELYPNLTDAYIGRGNAWAKKGNMIRAHLDFIRYKVPLLRKILLLR